MKKLAPTHILRIDVPLHIVDPPTEPLLAAIIWAAWPGRGW